MNQRVFVTAQAGQLLAQTNNDSQAARFARLEAKVRALTQKQAQERRVQQRLDAFVEQTQQTLAMIQKRNMTVHSEDWSDYDLNAMIDDAMRAPAKPNDGEPLDGYALPSELVEH